MILLRWIFSGALVGYFIVAVMQFMIIWSVMDFGKCSFQDKVVVSSMSGIAWPYWSIREYVRK